uniref:DUF2235 domain-containing protein n=1 Tax=Bradyrhizobium barranii subsp. barranii TaxID=2823807 RepID=A0A7Z0TPV9_9BRAD
MQWSTHPIRAENLVVRCDDTGNEISENISNVLKLHLCLRKLDRTQPQHIALYDPGAAR